MTKKSNLINTNILIAGGGICGLSLAIYIANGLKQQIPITICDPIFSENNITKNNQRALAITPNSAGIFSKLNLWKNIAPHAYPTKKIIVTDSYTNNYFKQEYLSLIKELNNNNNNTLFYMVFNKIILKYLINKCLKLNIALIPSKVEKFHLDNNKIIINTHNNNNIKANLLIVSQGSNSSLTELSNMTSIKWNYQQASITATIQHEENLQNCAYEHFLPEGPLAILPSSKNISTIVWTKQKNIAQKICTLNEKDFIHELKKDCYPLNNIKLIDKPRANPLKFSLTKRMFSKRIAFVGDSAHLIHPLAGQGLNLGLKDVNVLGDLIIKNARLGLDTGSSLILKEYQSQRLPDNLKTAITMDIINKAFSNNNPIIRIIRNVGLNTINKLPHLKKIIINQASS